MKIKLDFNALENTKASSSSAVAQFVQFFKKIGVKAKSERRDLYAPEDDHIQNDINLYVDFNEISKNEFSEKSADLAVVIFVGESSEFTDNSIPCLEFSLDSLIDEKIELLDADLVSETKIAVLKRLAIRLNDHSHQLNQAIRRYQLKKTNAYGKNSPLW